MAPSGINSNKPPAPPPDPGAGGAAKGTGRRPGTGSDEAQAPEKARGEGSGQGARQAPGKGGEGSGRLAEREQARRQQARKEGSNEDLLAQAERRVNEALEKLDFRLNFSIDEEAEELVVKVVDPDSDEVIRELPPEEMRELAQRMEELTGILLDERR